MPLQLQISLPNFVAIVVSLTIHTTDKISYECKPQRSISLFTLSLPDTYLIPKLNFNLISVVQSRVLVYELTFSSSGCRVQDTHTIQLIGIGCKIIRLFELTQLHVSHESNICVALHIHSFNFGIDVLPIVLLANYII